MAITIYVTSLQGVPMINLLNQGVLDSLVAFPFVQVQGPHSIAGRKDNLGLAAGNHLTQHIALAINVSGFS